MRYQRYLLTTIPALLCLALARPVLSAPNTLPDSIQPTQAQSVPEVHATQVAQTLPAADAQVKTVEVALQPAVQNPAPVASAPVTAEKQATAAKVVVMPAKRVVKRSHPIAVEHPKKSVEAPVQERVAQPTVLTVKLDSQDAPPVQEKNEGFISRMVDATKGLMSRAASWLGTRYVWGGSSRHGVDCSGLTRLIYGSEGVNLPHKAKLQYQRGQVVARAGLLPGDLVFFNTRGPISHVGIYIGEGKFLHAANPRKGVRVDSLSAPYYSKRFAGARRYKDYSEVG